MSNEPSNKRIDEAHSHFPKSAAEQTADHGDELGFKHRTYTQSHLEDCYICTLLRRVAELEKRLVAPEERAWKSPKELPAVGQFCAVLTFDSEVGITDWRIANVRWDIGVKGWYPIPSPYVLEPQRGLSPEEK